MQVCNKVLVKSRYVNVSHAMAQGCSRLEVAQTLGCDKADAQPLNFGGWLKRVVRRGERVVDASAKKGGRKAMQKEANI